MAREVFLGVAERPKGTKRRCGWERRGMRWVERCLLGCRHEGRHVWGPMRRVGQPEPKVPVGGEGGPVPVEEDP